MSDKVTKYRSPEVTRQAGEVARLRVLKGAEMGATFVIKASSIKLGRGDEVDLLIADPKSSRAHARLDYTREGWVMSDLGSANGIFFQGEYIRKFALQSTDHFTIGETLFEFLTSQESTRLLISKPRDGHEVERLDQALSQQKARVKNLSQTVKTAKNPNAKKSSPLTLILLAVLGGGYFLMDDEAKPVKSVSSKKTDSSNDKPVEDRSLASYLPGGVSKEVAKTADQYYLLGFREYLKGNYLRAKDNFELSLQVDPSHPKARHFLASAEKENQDEIRKLIAGARKAKLVGRLSDAKGNCETALRHLYNDRANPDYADCDELLKELKGETP